MSDQIIQTDLGGGVARLTLNRAPVNALTPAFLDAFARVLDDLAAETDVRAVILDSARKVYSAGLDLNAAQEFDAADQNAIVDALNSGFLTQFCFPKPIVAAINGAAIAGGFFFVLAADWRVSASHAQFGLAEVRVGADLPVGPMEIARATLDPNDLRRLLLTGQPEPAAFALERGYIDQVCPAEDVAATAEAKARELADKFGYVEPHLWTGVGRARSGCGAALVGSTDQVMSKIKDYQKMGIRSFIFSGYPHIDECISFGQRVLPNLKTVSLPEAYGRVPGQAPATPLAVGERR